MLKKGFTLAEVLMTLAIIGVIAAITLPALMVNVNDNVLEAQAKKFYSQTIDAIDLFKARNEVDTLTSLMNRDGSMQTFANGIMSTSIAANTAEGAQSVLGAQYTNINRGNAKTLAEFFGTISENNPVYRLRDGSEFTIRNNNDGTWKMAVDVNGRRGPNRIGEDTYTMIIDGNPGTVRIIGEDMTAANCLSNDINTGSCMALFVANNFRFRNYRDSIANAGSPDDGGNNNGSGSGFNGGNMDPFPSGSGQLSGGRLNNERLNNGKLPFNKN